METYLVVSLMSLLILLLVQQCFWMFYTQKLINKLMSRNYGEFVQSEVLKEPAKKKQNLTEELKDTENLAALSDFSII